jgi:hypothetical protein
MEIVRIGCYTLVFECWLVLILYISFFYVIDALGLALTLAGMKRSGDRSFAVSINPKHDARRNDSKCTKTAMFYDLLLAVVNFILRSYYFQSF